jgi:uncharacterized protein (TIGR02757 family)
MVKKDIKNLLDFYAQKYNQSKFIINDPIQIPHRYSRLQDIEIAAFWTAILSWGNRKTIIKNADQLMNLMGNSPYDFIIHHKERHRQLFSSFKHRTFQYTDTLYFLEFFQQYYRNNDSLESAFISQQEGRQTMELRLATFNKNFFSLPEISQRTRKHISNPLSGSRCKRMIMFLRWMVRKDSNGVDFGVWNQIQPSELMIPLDVHVERTARALGLLKRKNLDWKAVMELSQECRNLRPEDPALYDFALFGLSQEKNTINYE